MEVASIVVTSIKPLNAIVRGPSYKADNSTVILSAWVGIAIKGLSFKC